jgi:outer membrane protein OmpA-like peptidoglycan-associated protein
MKATWKKSLLMAAATAGITAGTILGNATVSYAARPVDQAYTTVTNTTAAPEDLGYEVLLRNQMVAMLAAPGAVPPPVPQKLLVFFETAKTDLCPDAKLIVREAAAEAQRDKPNNTTVIQVTDAAMKDRNPHLAQERAKVVKEELVRLGVPQEQIVVSNKEAPAPQGRKVEIVTE